MTLVLYVTNICDIVPVTSHVLQIYSFVLTGM